MLLASRCGCLRSAVRRAATLAVRDRILLRNLVFHSTHGALPEERVLGTRARTLSTAPHARSVLLSRCDARAHVLTAFPLWPAGQRFEVDIELRCSLSKAAASDSLADAVDYVRCCCCAAGLLLLCCCTYTVPRRRV